MYSDPTGHAVISIGVALAIIGISALIGAIDGVITASMSDSNQNLLLAGIAGAIGGAVSGALSLISIAIGHPFPIIPARGIGSIISNALNDMFQGEFNKEETKIEDRIAFYVVDAGFDMIYAMLYASYCFNITNFYSSAFLNATADTIIDVIEGSLFW